jgi:hypothetical protein
MAFNIETFKHNGLVYGGVRPSLFDVTVTPSAELQSLFNGANVQKLQFTCRASNLPAATIGTVEVPYFGRKIKLAGDRTYTDWQITVMNDEDFLVRSMFEVWQNSLNKVVNNVRDSAYVTETLYKAVFTINQYSKTGNGPQGGGIIDPTSVTPIRSYTMVGAYPGPLGDIVVDWDQQNQIETFTVGIPYDYWLPGVEGSLAVPYASLT